MTLAFHADNHPITWPGVAVIALVVICILGIMYFITKD